MPVKATAGREPRGLMWTSRRCLACNKKRTMPVRANKCGFCLSAPRSLGKGRSF